MDKVTITYNGEEIEVDRTVADFLDAERRREQAQDKSDQRHISDKDLDRYDFNSFIADKPADFTEAIYAAEDIKTLYQAMKTLTETQRRRVELYFFDGLTFRQIAEIEKANEKSIRESINGGLKKLKDFFE